MKHVLMCTSKCPATTETDFSQLYAFVLYFLHLLVGLHCERPKSGTMAN